MRLANQKLLIKHLRKNKGNKHLEAAIRKLIKDFEANEWKLYKTEQTVPPVSEQTVPVISLQTVPLWLV
jgi:hypothetical protein